MYNLFNTLTVAPGPPGQPRASNVNDTSMIISWTQPKSDGGAKITEYIIESKQATTTPTWKKVKTLNVEALAGALDSLEVTVTGLKVGSTYEFRVKARNKSGIGKLSPVSKSYPACGKFNILLMEVMM